MQTSTQRTQPEHPPLARDAQGNLLELPKRTAAWRVCRQTTGRPRAIVGPDKQPMRFPLDITGDELADLCGPELYRLYALDEVGKVLDYVTTVDVSRETHELRNVTVTETTALASLRATPAPATSDLRFALESMAQMMRVTSEALRAVAESQADWVKSIASTRGFFRNGPPPYPPPPQPGPDDLDDADDEDDDPAQRKTIYDVLAPIAENLAPSVKPIISMLTSGAGNAPRNGAALAAGDLGDADAQLAAKPNWELRDLVDFNYASAKARARKGAKETNPAVSLQARVMSDPKLLSHFIAIKALLQADEGMKLLVLGERMSERERESLLAEISALSPVDAAQLLQAVLVELEDAAKPITTESAT